jgi:alkylation response protein AidB-like acyl-CoA dehydrogenase
MNRPLPTATARAVGGVADDSALDDFAREVDAWLAPRLAERQTLRLSAIWSVRENRAEAEFRRRLARALGEAGWLFPLFPPEYGGGGLSLAHHMVIERALDAHGINFLRVFDTEACIVAPCILHWGSDEQKLDFLPPMLRGEVQVWQVLTEPQGGSDPATCLTTAIRDGDVYRVNGQKTMVGSTEPPDFLWTLVCTQPQGERHRNLSWLYIPANLPGITVAPLEMLMGVKNTVFFDDVEVPASYLVGGENNGWAVSTTHLELEHGGAGSIAADPIPDRLVGFCRATGAADLDDPHIRELIAEMAIECHVGRLMARRNWVRRLSRRPHPYGGPQHRYYQRILRLRNAHRLQQILGYDALRADPDVDEEIEFSWLARSGPGMLHGGGTLDTDRLILSRRLGLGREPTEAAPQTI